MPSFIKKSTDRFLLYIKANPLDFFCIVFGHLFFIAMFFIAMEYYKERVLSFDGAFQTFKLIHFQKFNIEADRYGVIPTQLLPLWAIKSGWSLETVLKLYSVSFVLVPYLVYLIIQFVFKNSWMSLILIFSLCIGYRYCFYYTISEIHQTIAPTILLLALFHSDLLNKKTVHKIIFSICYILILGWLMSIHKLALISIIFVLVYSVLSQKDLYKNLWFVNLSWLAVVANVYMIMSIPKGSYEDGRMIKSDAFFNAVMNLGEIPAYRFFKVEFHKNYYLLSLVGIVSLSALLAKKRFLTAAFFLVFSFCFFVVLMAYDTPASAPIVFQNYYPLFGIFFSIPFLLDFGKKINWRVLAVLSVVIVSVSVYKINKSSIVFTQRTDYMKTMLNNTKRFPEQKFIVDNENIPWKYIWVDWDIPFESLFLSSIPSPDSSRSFCTVENVNKYDSMIVYPDRFIGVSFSPFWFSQPDFDQRYFGIKNGPFRKLTSQQTDSFAVKRNQYADKIILHFPQKEISRKYFDWYVLPIEVTNQSKDTIASGMRQTKFRTSLFYHVYDKNNKEIVVPPEFAQTALPIDLFPQQKFTFGLNIDYLEKGEYTIEADLRTGTEWWKLNEKCKLIIN